MRRSSAAPKVTNNYKSQPSSQGGRSGRGNSGPAGMPMMPGKQPMKQNTNSSQQQYLPQYFLKQKKQSNYINSKYGQESYNTGKFSQIDSPKDSSIERIRQDDILQHEFSHAQMTNQNAVE